MLRCATGHKKDGLYLFISRNRPEHPTLYRVFRRGRGRVMAAKVSCPGPTKPVTRMNGRLFGPLGKRDLAVL